MPTVVGVVLRNAPSAELVEPAGVETTIDDVVVVETDRGTELGRIATAEREREEGDAVTSHKLVRVATDEDLKKAASLHAREKEAMQVYRRLVAKHGLEMKPTEVEILFDESKAVFYFVAEDRVDFRDLVRDLAAEFHLRIDMRQIGVRDEARIVGGLGHCGEQLCCVRFGGEFQPVSIRMAKEQDLPLNPLKISGLCGRLMCCLRYEYEAYKDFKGRAPKKGAIVDCGGDPGKVVELDTPRERVTIRKEDGSRVTVGLADMECGCGGKGGHGANAPCCVRREALERQMENLIDLPSSVVAPRERKLTESSAPREAVSAPSETEAPEAPSTGGRRRRRRGGEAASAEVPKKAEAKAETPAKSGEAKKPARRRRGGKSAAAKAAGQATAPQADAGASPAGTAADAPKRRRRRRRGGGAAGEAPAE